jgi:hypothetical protein
MRKKSTKLKRVKIPKSTGKERKAFAVKMLVDNPKPVWIAELKAVKDIYELFPIDFLNKVRKPDFKINSCFYFLSENGKEYLTKKLKEFLYKPVKYDIVEGTEKVGEDWQGTKRRGLRDFIEGN